MLKGFDPLLKENDILLEMVWDDGQDRPFRYFACDGDAIKSIQ